MSNTTKRIFFLDAYGLIFRAYYAFIKNPRINSKSLDVSATFGFVNTLFDLLKKEKPTHISVAFDAPAQSNRSKMYSEYKANRLATPEAIKSNIPYIKEFLTLMGINQLELNGYEADDIIGTLAKNAEKEGYEVYMVTSDKDFAQLVTDKIFMYKPATKFGGVEKLGRDEINKKYGFDDPIQMIDYLGMMGDSSDNIPGLPGVGEKTAMTFIQKYKSMENLFENLDDIKGKIKDKIAENKELGIMSKKLATIITDVPIEMDFEKMTIDPQFTEVYSFFEEMEFNRTKQTFDNIFGQNKDATKSISLFSNQEESKNEKFSIEVKEFSSKTHLKLWLDNIKNDIAVIFENEKTWVQSSENIIYCIKGDLLSSFLESLPDFSQKIYTINLKESISHYESTVFAIKHLINDIQILAHIVDSSTNKDIDLLYKKFVSQYHDYEISNNLESQSDKITYLPKITKLGEYFTKEILERKYSKILDYENELAFVLYTMEKNGIKMDTKSLKNLSEQYGKEINALEEEIYTLTDTEEKFNIASPKQLGEVLFEKLKIDSKPSKTKTGNYGTSEDILLKYVDTHACIPKILEWRTISKIKNTYLDSMPKYIDSRTQRIHAQYNQIGTVTGRLSSNNPNMQNLPINTSKGRKIREIIIPEPDNLFFSVDYSQIELRVIASMSEESKMIEDFNKNIDIHTATAAYIYNKDIDQITREERSHAKTVNFGIIYGVSSFGLSRQTSLNVKESKEFIALYHKTYPKIEEYIQETIQSARENGYVETLLGRRRYLPDIQSSNNFVRSGEERNAINTTIQGTAADIIKMAMIKIQEKIFLGDIKATLISQIHDELLFEIPKDMIEESSKKISEIMETVHTLKVPLTTESGWGKNWMEAH